MKSNFIQKRFEKIFKKATYSFYEVYNELLKKYEDREISYEEYIEINNEYLRKKEK